MTFKADEGWEEPILSMLGRWALTLLLIFALLLLSTFPFKFANFGEIRPSFMLIAVYYWAIMRPQTLSPAATFIVGIAFDLMTGSPLALNALTLLLVQWITQRQRKFLLGQPFLVMWMGLGLVAIGASAMQWALYSLFYLEAVSVRDCLMSALMTAAVFPLVVMPLSAFNKMLADRRSSL
jgi:rod shape-determining protein MreD